MSRIARIALIALVATAGVARAQITDTTVVTSRVSVSPSSASTWSEVVMSCPAGLVALSGGIDTAGFNSIEVGSSAPSFAGTSLAFQPNGTRSAANGWYVTVKNLSQQAIVVSGVVVCAPVTNVIVSVNSATIPAGIPTAPATGGISAICPAGYAAVGGGADLPLRATMRASANGPVFGQQYLVDVPGGQQSAPTGWNANVRNEGGSGTLKVAAICMPQAGLFAVVTNAFTATAITVSGASARCPAGSIALGGGIDVTDQTKDVIAVSTPLFPGEPQFPVDRGTGSHSSANGWYSIVYNYGPANSTARVAVVCAAPTAGVVVVYEFYNTQLRHYFRTSSSAEAAGIDGGSAGPGWQRTGDNFFAYTPGANAPGSDVCRFYTFAANSHFYTAFADECAGLKSPSSGWVYEGLSFKIPLPTANGCTAGTIPVYRLYNNRFQFSDSNHRFTTQIGDIAPLQQQGWIYEGVAFCAPSF